MFSVRCVYILGAKRSKEENLKEMGDVSSGMASTIIQIYLKEILTSYLHPDILVRHAALKVIQLILQQGLVHPVQVIYYQSVLYSMSHRIHFYFRLFHI